MQWIILIGDENLTLKSIKSIEHYDSIRVYDVNENRYCVEFGNDHIFYEINADIVNDYEDEELVKLKALPFDKFNFVMMIYTLEERMRNILRQSDFLRDIYVDNDHGLIVPIDEFLSLDMPI